MDVTVKAFAYNISTQCALSVFVPPYYLSFKLKRFVFVVCMYVPMSNNKVTSLRDIDIYYSLMWANTQQNDNTVNTNESHIFEMKMEWCVKSMDENVPFPIQSTFDF